MQETFSICCVSDDDEYLAACTLAGSICIWRLTTNPMHGQLVSRSEYRRQGKARQIASMLWHPANPGRLVIADVDVGQSWGFIILAGTYLHGGERVHGASGERGGSRAGRGPP